MRDTTRALIGYYMGQLDLSGRVLEISGHRPTRDATNLFPEPHTVVADITDSPDAIPDESFDLVFSSDVFERIDRPWLAAAEVSRILKPGGIVITHTASVKGDASTADYWRYTPEGLAFLFADLECLEKGYDVSDEQWMVYCVSRKGSGPQVTRFQDSGHPLAVNLRQDVRGVPDPTLSRTGPPAHDPLEALRPTLTEINDRLIGLEKLVEDRIGQLDVIDTRSRRLERRIDRAVASFPLRTILRIRRGLYRLLK
jgi:hypothetical protein